MPKPFICPRCGDDLELSPRCQCDDKSNIDEPTTDYKPDWDSIPKEFNYCYYHAHAVDDPDKQLILTKYGTPNLGHLNCVVRPPELVDGAWYAVEVSGNKLPAYNVDGYLWISGESFHSDDDKLTIHNRIPDELWGDE